jgi:hypothetical protein
MLISHDSGDFCTVIFIVTDYTDAGKMFHSALFNARSETNKLRLEVFISFVMLCYVMLHLNIFHLEFDLERPKLINIYQNVVFMRWKGQACYVKDYLMQETHLLNCSVNE